MRFILTDPDLIRCLLFAHSQFVDEAEDDVVDAAEDAQRARTRQEQLTRLMEQSVALEDFETAAQLRDQLRALAAKEAQA